MKKLFPYFMGYIVCVVMDIVLLHWFKQYEGIGSVIQALISGACGMLALYIFFNRKKQVKT